jgi:hypothetical protein
VPPDIPITPLATYENLHFFCPLNSFLISHETILNETQLQVKVRTIPSPPKNILNEILYEQAIKKERF